MSCIAMHAPKMRIAEAQVLLVDAIRTRGGMDGQIFGRSILLFCYFDTAAEEEVTALT